MDGTGDTVLNISQSQSKDDHPPRYPESAVAVIGVACRFAGADSVEQLWQILESGTSKCDSIPKWRLPDFRFERRLFKQDFRGSMLNDIDAFDHKFFNVPSREATFRDPQQRLALEVTYQALESAGYFSQEITEERRDMGCYMATAMNEYHENVVTHEPSAFSLIGSIRPFIAGQVSHYFGFTGPAVIFDAACAASGVAVNTACRAVASGECKSAIAGATNVFISPDTFQDLAAGHFTSPTGSSKAFDAAADGYGRGEGVAVIVLKKLSDALDDGDVIKGVISATAVNQCTNDSPITIPHAPSQSSLYRKTLRLAQLNAQDIGYVEAHGTGTRVGDPIEAESIRAVFGDPSRKSSGKTYIGSLKSNIGHTEASSGLSGLIKVMLMIEKGVIPQQALFNCLHPDIPPLEPHGLDITTKNVPWTSSFKAGCVNNYGASGSNACMIVAQPPRVTDKEPAPQINAYPVSITAFSQTSLRAYSSALLDFIDHLDPSDSLLAGISYHLSRRRNPELPYSITKTVSTLNGLKEILVAAQSESSRQTEKNNRSIVLFFGGQTGKTASVSRALYDSCANLRKHLDDCDASLKALGSTSIFPTIFTSENSDNSVLDHSRLFSVQYASAKAWIDSGVQPARLIGHSFGQLTALCVSGALSLSDALKFVIGRAHLIDTMWDSNPGSMIAIEGPKEELSWLLTREAHLGLEVACYNGAHSFVLAGTTASVDSMEASLQASPGSPRFKRLQVPRAFHSVLATPLINPLQHLAEGLNFKRPTIPIETCSEGSTWQSIVPSRIALHTREPVYFHQAVQRIAQQFGPSIWVEAGSGGNASLLRRALEPQVSAHEIKSLKIDSTSSVQSLAELTADLWQLGLKVQFWPFHHSQRHQYPMLNLPPYQFDKTRHWLEWKELGIQPPTEAPHVPEQKPFLQLLRKTSNGGEFQVNTQFESWRTVCAKNCIVGSSACPLSLLLSLVIEAIHKIQGTSGHEAGSHYRVQELKMPTPIPANTDNRLSLHVVRGDSPQSWTFRWSKPSNTRFKFASGVILAGDSVSRTDFTPFERLIDTARIEDLMKDSRTDSIRGRGVYKGFADSFQISKQNQIIREVSAKDNEAAALLMSLPNNSLAALENLIQVPLVCLNSLHECPDDVVYINTSIRDSQFRLPTNVTADTTNSCSVYVRFSGLESQSPACDMYVFDTQTDQLHVILLDVGFARLQVKSLQKILSSTGEIDSQQTAGAKVDAPKAEAPKPEGDFIPSSRNPELILYNDDEPMQSGSPADPTNKLYDALVRIADVDVDKLRGNTLVADLGIDSLMGMEVADEINKVFAVDIDMPEFIAAEDLDALCRLVGHKAVGYSYNSGNSSGSSSLVSADSGSTPSSSNTEVSTDCEESEVARGSPKSLKAAATPMNLVFQAFDGIRGQFDILAMEAGCDKFWSDIHPLQMRLIEAYIFEAFSKLNCDVGSISTGGFIPEIPHKPEHENLLNRLMLVLRDGGFVTQAGKHWLRTEKPLPIQPSSAELFDQLQAQFPNWAPEHELLHLAGSNLAGHFDGTQDPLKLLFGSPERRKLMADQYLYAPIQSSVSRQLASFIVKCFGSHTFTEPLRVLEIGGGTCGTTLFALDAFVKIGVPIEYTFTDISSSFVYAAKSKLKGYSFVKYETLDVTEVPPAESRNQYDMIIATNVVHATPEVVKSAANIRQMLRPGGFFTMVEYTRIYAAIDVIFGQLDGWWAFADGRTHAIIDEHQWDTTLKRAGYDRVDWTGSKTLESGIVKIFLAS